MLPSNLPDVIATEQDWCEETNRTWHWSDRHDKSSNAIRLAPIDDIDHPLELLGYLVKVLI